MSDSGAGREPRRRRFSGWIDAAALALIVVTWRGLAHEFEQAERAGLFEHGYRALAFGQIGGEFWSTFPGRAAVALGAVVALAAILRVGRLSFRLGRRASIPLRVAAALALLAPVAFQVAARVIREDATRNVVIVVMDTLRADHLGAYGYRGATSPRLDAFASDAFVFERARSTASWTRPAIASLLTAQYPFDHGIYRERKQDRLPRATPTLQQIARNHGLRAEAIVTQPHYKAGLDRDFDSFMIEGNQKAEKIYDWAIDFLDGHGDEPFFLLVHNLDPHDAYGFRELPRESKWRSSKPLLPAQQPGNGIGFDSPENRAVPLGPEELAQLVSNYDGEIRYLDHHFGRFLDALEARGAMDDTLILVTSDHGEEFLDHGSYWHGGTLHEELVRIPLIVRAPGLGSGRRAAAVSLVDVLPTVAEWLQVPAPGTARGRSLLPLMRGEPAEARPIFSATGFRQKRIQQSVVFGGKKLIRREDGEFVGLFDLETDPLERSDLGPDDPDRAPLEALLPVPVAPSAKAAEARPLELDDDLMAALEALGYAAD